MIGNDKQGALETYDLDGTLVQRIDVADEVLGQRRRAPGRAARHRPDRRGGGRERRAPPVRRGPRPPAGSPRSRRVGPHSTPVAAKVCASIAQADGDLSVFMVLISGQVRQYDLPDDGYGTAFPEEGARLRGRVGGRGLRGRRREQGALHGRGGRRALEVRRRPRPGARSASWWTRSTPKGHSPADIEGVTLVDDGGGRGLRDRSSQGPQGASRTSPSSTARRARTAAPSGSSTASTPTAARTPTATRPPPAAGSRLPARRLHLPGRPEHRARRGRQPGLQADPAGEGQAVTRAVRRGSSSRPGRTADGATPSPASGSR